MSGDLLPFVHDACMHAPVARCWRCAWLSAVLPVKLLFFGVHNILSIHALGLPFTYLVAQSPSDSWKGFYLKIVQQNLYIKWLNCGKFHYNCMTCLSLSVIGHLSERKEWTTAKKGEENKTQSTSVHINIKSKMATLLDSVENSVWHAFDFLALEGDATAPKSKLKVIITNNIVQDHHWHLILVPKCLEK